MKKETGGGAGWGRLKEGMKDNKAPEEKKTTGEKPTFKPQMKKDNKEKPKEDEGWNFSTGSRKK